MVKRGCQSPPITPSLYEMPGRGEQGKKGPWHRSSDQGEQSRFYTSLVRTGSYASSRTVPGRSECDWLTPVRIHPLPPGLGTLPLKPIGGLSGRKIRLHRASGGPGLCRGNGGWRRRSPSISVANRPLQSDGLGSSPILLLAG